VFPPPRPTSHDSYSLCHATNASYRGASPPNNLFFKFKFISSLRLFQQSRGLHAFALPCSSTAWGTLKSVWPSLLRAPHILMILGQIELWARCFIIEESDAQYCPAELLWLRIWYCDILPRQRWLPSVLSHLLLRLRHAIDPLPSKNAKIALALRIQPVAAEINCAPRTRNNSAHCGLCRMHSPPPSGVTWSLYFAFFPPNTIR
jgi:hypothetical protein